jgi:Domain of unknown function (DUF5679)
MSVNERGFQRAGGYGLASARSHGSLPVRAYGDWRVIMAEEYKGEAYCVKCKEKRAFEGHVKVSDSGRRMAQGICPVCGTKVNRILGKA